MHKKIQSTFALLSLLVTASIAVPIEQVQAKPPLQLAIKRQEFRHEFIKIEALIDTLGITKGMTILDIGSGPGYASFLFAEKLHGGGEVFATDIRADFVNYIAEEAKKRGLKNLFPVVVKDEGLDDFYAGHRYDLVFLSNVYHCIDKRIEYFSRLRKFLKPNARLVLILYNQVPLFSSDDLTDIDGLLNSLSKEAGDDPFVGGLSAATRQLIKDKGYKDALRMALVGDFNRMLTELVFISQIVFEQSFTVCIFRTKSKSIRSYFKCGGLFVIDIPFYIGILVRSAGIIGKPF